MIKAAVFDMDGTILNTISDLTDSLNYALVETGHKGGHPEEMVKLCFGWALNLDMIKALAMAKGFSAKDLELAGNKIPVEDIPATEEEINELMDVFTSYYGSHNQIKTKPYSGIPEVIRALRKKGIRCAVASNKDDDHVQILSEKLFPGLFDISIGRNSEMAIKPDPEMILSIARRLGIKAKEIVYIGDSEVDIMTGKKGGFPSISVAWGFRTGEFLKNHGAERIADKPEDIIEIIKKIQITDSR